MTKRILVNAQNMEETRVAVIDDKELVDFDSEVRSKKPIKGNIYLAKVIRVEPSLQAVFIDYGGDRNGFLPFAEIHPDYYRIPADDLKQAEEEAEEATAQAASAEVEAAISESATTEAEIVLTDVEVTDDEIFTYPESVQAIPAGMPKKGKSRTQGGAKATASEAFENTFTSAPETSMSTPSMSAYREQKKRIRQRKSRYRVQEVIFPKQILLVQAIKDKRGKKCAAFSTYLSLAGQYCVLMPNAGERMGGVSKRIQEDDTRKRLRDIIKDLEIPSKMSMIIRTAGQERTKTEIKRDYEYLMRIWDDIRAKTLESNAPQLIHAEADILMRVVRDFYQKNVSEIVADTQEAYKQIRIYMKKLSPSGVRKVKLYKDGSVALFNAYDIESQIIAMVSPRVELPSGGSLVIGQTEALVAIDVNSGRATRERNLDTTALKTNLEAAKEIARQVRLRDLSGLIVIDFIDMADKRHIQQVETFFQQALKLDRARVQTAPISPFGLLEMSRQRLRSSVMEVYSEICPHCQGRGRVYSTGYFVTTALHILEKAILAEKLKAVRLLTPVDIASDLLNKYRRQLFDLEQKHDCTITVQADANLADTDFIVDKGQGTPALFSLEKTDEDSVTENDLNNLNPFESSAPTASTANISLGPATSTSPRGGGTKTTKSKMERVGRNKAQLKKQIISELNAVQEDETIPFMSTDYDAFEPIEDVTVDEPVAINDSVKRTWAIRQNWKQHATNADDAGESVILRSSQTERDWVDGEIRLLDTAEVVPFSEAKRSGETERRFSFPSPVKNVTLAGAEGVEKSPESKQRQKNSQTIKVKTQASLEPTEENTERQLTEDHVHEHFLSQGALTVEKPSSDRGSIHVIKTQVINPDLWKSLLKKKDYVEELTSSEPSFTQAIKERLAGEDVLSPDKNGKKVRRAWLNDLLLVRKKS